MELSTKNSLLSAAPAGKRERMAFYEEAMRDPKNHGALALELAYLREKLDASTAGEPVAEVVSWTNGSYSRNYKLKWLKDVPEGAKLYAHPIVPASGADVEAKPAASVDVGREFYDAARAADLGSHPDDWDGLTRLWKKAYTLAAQRFMAACGSTPVAHTLPALRLIAAATAVCDHRYGSGAPFGVIYEELKYAAEDLASGLPHRTPPALTSQQKEAMHDVVGKHGGYTNGLLPAMWAAAHSVDLSKADPEHLKNALRIVTGWLEQARAGTLQGLPYMTNGMFANDLESLRDVLAEHVGGAA